LNWNTYIGKICRVIVKSQNEELMAVVTGLLELSGGGGICLVRSNDGGFISFLGKSVSDDDIFLKMRDEHLFGEVIDTFKDCEMVVIVTITVREFEEE